MLLLLLLLIYFFSVQGISDTEGDNNNNNNNHLYQRVSVLVHRFNAVLLHDSLPVPDCTDSASYPFSLFSLNLPREKIPRVKRKKEEKIIIIILTLLSVLFCANLWGVLSRCILQWRQRVSNIGGRPSLLHSPPLPSLSLPSPPYPSPPSPPLSLEVGSLNPARGSGERC